MSQQRGLNDQEVQQEMNKLQLFIRQEAEEKARELKVKADEEYNIEKSKLVRQESLTIEAAFQRKVKQAEVQKKIAQSSHINKSRLRVLAAREQNLEELFNEARKRLHAISADAESYKSLVADLILQGLYQLMEAEVTVAFREKDAAIVKEAAAIATGRFAEALKKKVNIIFDTTFLPETSAGGIVISAFAGRIRISNTLESRLGLVCEETLPDIRTTLFGPSPNRKFYN